MKRCNRDRVSLLTNPLFEQTLRAFQSQPFGTTKPTHLVRENEPQSGVPNLKKAQPSKAR